MTLQQYMNDQFVKHVELCRKHHDPPRHPEDFIEDFDASQLIDEHWYSEPIYDALEDLYYKEYGKGYDKPLCEDIIKIAEYDLRNVCPDQLHESAVEAV